MLTVFFMVFILSQVSLHICYNHLYVGAYFYKIVVFCWIFFIFWYFFSHSTHICYNHLRLCPASIWINVVISINTVSPFFQISIFWHSFNCVWWICNDKLMLIEWNIYLCLQLHVLLFFACCSRIFMMNCAEMVCFLVKLTQGITPQKNCAWMNLLKFCKNQSTKGLNQNISYQVNCHW